ncbi:arginine repressor [Myxococcota bacterium]|nr:arginine repressor [Myxococcota bacterium]
MVTDRARARRQALLGIVREGTSRTQDDLAERLRLAGFAATQSAISRDIRALGIAKAEGRYVLPGAPGPEAPSPGAPQVQSPDLADVARYCRDAVPAGPHLLVVHTLPAMAQAVASALDAAGLPGVLGTVSGDDTLFVAVSDPERQRSLLALLESAFHPAGSRGSRPASSAR